MAELLYLLLTTHFTIICVTVYLHRSQAHKSVTLSPVISHIMRFWLWLTTGMITKEWVAVHRKHHRFCDHEQDPHSPRVHGIAKVLFKGSYLYYQATKNVVDVETYGKQTPDDWIEKNLYTKHHNIGIILLLIFNLSFFDWLGLAIWAIQMIWIPFWAAGVINGLGHFIGYRNWATKDFSKNIFPFGILIGGEELHNNHHHDPKSCKLKNKWYEIDIGYMYIRLFVLFRLARI